MNTFSSSTNNGLATKDIIRTQDKCELQRSKTYSINLLNSWNGQQIFTQTRQLALARALHKNWDNVSSAKTKPRIKVAMWIKFIRFSLCDLRISL